MLVTIEDCGPAGAGSQSSLTNEQIHSGRARAEGAGNIPVAEITGTRLKHHQISSPLEVISREDIDAGGKRTLSDVVPNDLDVSSTCHYGCCHPLPPRSVTAVDFAVSGATRVARTSFDIFPDWLFPVTPRGAAM
jgi:hypothetical protein